MPLCFCSNNVRLDFSLCLLLMVPQKEQQQPPSHSSNGVYVNNRCISPGHSLSNHCRILGQTRSVWERDFFYRQPNGQIVPVWCIFAASQNMPIPQKLISPSVFTSEASNLSVLNIQSLFAMSTCEPLEGAFIHFGGGDGGECTTKTAQEVCTSFIQSCMLAK